jgi:23S rRNA (cytosine1962-C5)-methyltransferase
VARAVLKAGREGPFLGRHPWVFSGAIASLQGGARDGEEVEVVTSRDQFVGVGLHNSRSQIRIRLYSWEPSTPLDRDFWSGRLEQALQHRWALGFGRDDGTSARLVFSEADGLSGLTVDRYDQWLVVQFTSLALYQRRELILDLLEERLRPRGILLRTERGILEEEGLEARDGLLRGEAPEGPVTLREGGLSFLVDLGEGQKTGFFLDQRDNRAAVAALGRDLRCADICCYSGGFGLALAQAGARSVVGVDTSAAAIDLANRNAELNDLAGRFRAERGDAAGWLRDRSESGERFDLIVLDPPRFARSRQGVKQALKGYRRLNIAAVQALRPGGILVTCSCSGRVSRDQFVGVLGSVAATTRRHIRIQEIRGQPADHPVSASCPETEYLKCLICRVE